MGEDLPDAAALVKIKKYYAGLTTGSHDEGPWLGFTDDTAPLPFDDAHIEGIIKRLKFHPSPNGEDGKPNMGRPSSPRKMKGFVNVDSSNLLFPDIDDQSTSTKETIAACRKLKERVDAIADIFLAGKKKVDSGTA
jgi:hypothetical protein